MGKRKTLKGLKWAKMLDQRPPFIPPAKRSTGPRRAGIVYEYRVVKLLRAMYGEDMVLHGPWIEYEDNRGKGWCQPDALLLPPSEDKPLIIIECKLTAKSAAEQKLKNIYGPVIETIFQVPLERIKLVQVCKNLNKTFDGILLEDVEQIYEGDWDFATLWMRTPIG